MTGFVWSMIQTRPVRSHTNMRPDGVNAMPTASFHCCAPSGRGRLASVKPVGSVVAKLLTLSRASSSVARSFATGLPNFMRDSLFVASIRGFSKV